MVSETLEREVDGVRVRLETQSNGSYCVTSPDLPEVLTVGDTEQEALENVRDAIATVREAYTSGLLPYNPADSRWKP